MHLLSTPCVLHKSAEDSGSQLVCLSDSLIYIVICLLSRFPGELYHSQRCSNMIDEKQSISTCVTLSVIWFVSVSHDLPLCLAGWLSVSICLLLYLSLTLSLSASLSVSLCLSLSLLACRSGVKHSSHYIKCRLLSLRYRTHVCNLFKTFTFFVNIKTYYVYKGEPFNTIINMQKAENLDVLKR